MPYVDPAAGGSSGIYVSGLIDRLGIGAEVETEAVLVQGGAAADRVASGEADIALQQISEILPVKGAVLAGPLPSEDSELYDIFRCHRRWYRGKAGRRRR